MHSSAKSSGSSPVPGREAESYTDTEPVCSLEGRLVHEIKVTGDILSK